MKRDIFIVIAHNAHRKQTSNVLGARECVFAFACNNIWNHLIDLTKRVDVEACSQSNYEIYLNEQILFFCADSWGQRSRSGRRIRGKIQNSNCSLNAHHTDHVDVEGIVGVGPVLFSEESKHIKLDVTQM